MTKMTKKDALNYALENLVDAPAEVREKLESMVTALERKTTTERKPTKVQLENAELRAAVVEYINEHMTDTENGFTVSDLIQNCSAVEGMNPQKVAPLVKKAVELGELSSQSIKRRTHYIPFNPEVEG